MGWSWIKAPRISEDCQKGVEDFLQIAEQNAPVLTAKYLCPCVKCVNGRHQLLNDIRSHLICEGFSPSYTNWIWHVEFPHVSTTSQLEPVHVQTRDRMEDMIRDLGQEGFRDAHAHYYEKLQTDSKKPLYVWTKYLLHSTPTWEEDNIYKAQKIFDTKSPISVIEESI